MKTINYGIGREYLSSWGMKEALREIYQNFLDYGEYTMEILDQNEDMTAVSLRNSYLPENLEFLRLGNSMKHSDSIGKHGEGLKMALMIFKREHMDIEIRTHQHRLIPNFNLNDDVGDLFVINYEDYDNKGGEFEVNFEMPTDVFTEFTEDIITDEDVLFEGSIGRILNKESGRIYCGGLFVAVVKGLKGSYDFNPRYLPLDRDRAQPHTFDVEYNASRLNEQRGEFTISDFSHGDYSYVNTIPKDVKETITPVIVGNNIEFISEDKVIKSQRAVSILRSDSYFTEVINKLKIKLMEKLGLYELLEDFGKKHAHTKEAKEDLKYILEQVKDKKI